MADFQWELCKILPDRELRFLEIIGFRGSAKSTLSSLAFPLYAGLEQPEVYPFIIPIGDTGQQAALNIANIKNELETNELLRFDYGIVPEKKKFKNPTPTLESDEEWQAKNMLLNNGVRYLARSRGQKVRGLKHRQFRPKLITADDPEDLRWVKKRENRDETEKWYRGEVMPAGDRDTRYILIGNYLHENALMARMKKSGLFRVIEIPLIDPETHLCAWPAKYPTIESLRAQKKEAGLAAWNREYLLKAVPDEGQPVRPEDINYYDELPRINKGRTGHGIDLAISEKKTADYTAMVDGTVFYDANDAGRPHIYVRPNPFHQKCDLSILEVEMLRQQRAVPGEGHVFFVEAVGYQKVAINDMERKGINVVSLVPITDKRARLEVVVPYIKNGTILFPREGADELLTEIVHFGSEAHDDLVDALVYMILGLMESGLSLPVVSWM